MNGLLRKIRCLFRSDPYCPDDLYSVTIYTTRFDQFPEINKSWEAVISADRRLPARTAVGVSALPVNATVEMEFWFCK